MTTDLHHRIAFLEKQNTLLRNKARVLDYIACQPVGCMSSLILHWYPTCPPEAEYPDNVPPFTSPKTCTCVDIMGSLDDGEHFAGCPDYRNSTP